MADYVGQVSNVGDCSSGYCILKSDGELLVFDSPRLLARSVAKSLGMDFKESITYASPENEFGGFTGKVPSGFDFLPLSEGEINDFEKMVRGIPITKR